MVLHRMESFEATLEYDKEVFREAFHDRIKCLKEHDIAGVMACTNIMNEYKRKIDHAIHLMSIVGW